MGQPPKYFILKGVAGLGNRLLTAAWAIDYAQRSGRQLRLDWTDGLYGNKGEDIFSKYFSSAHIESLSAAHCRAIKASTSVYPFSWQNKPRASVYDLYHFQHVPRGIKQFRLHKLPFFWSRRLHGFWWPRSVKPLVSGGSQSAAIFSPQAVPLASYYPVKMKPQYIFGADYLPLTGYEKTIHHIQPNESIKQHVAKWLRSPQDIILSNVVGVHIRATDRQPEKQTDKLIRYIKNAFGSTRSIFLSTDNMFILADFKKHFPLVLTQTRTLPDTKGLGLHQWGERQATLAQREQMTIEAISDMYILSQCGSLLYQGNSSFSKVARHWASEHTRCIDWQTI